MNHRISSLALAGVLTLGLLTSCGGSQPPASSPAPESSAPVVSLSPSPAPTDEGSGIQPSDAPVSGGATDVPAETPAPEATQPAATPNSQSSSAPTAKPSSKPSAVPTATPTPAPTVSVVASIWADISKNELPTLTDLDADLLSSIYGIDASDLEEYICKMPLMNVQATEFFIAKVKDGKMDTVKKALQAHQADLEEQWSQYLPAQLELVQNYKLVTSGSYVLFAVTEYADSTVTAFNTYTK
ncbi:MAG: DUF4358 domain-containing protein [Clostridiales bacterium]|nr:DUF4358 domain-containing protein [Clostridiales bacterium]MDY4181784.1 DUF4358 domain-containing protein [Pseudoflavonifractor sp.]